MCRMNQRTRQITPLWVTPLCPAFPPHRPTTHCSTFSTATVALVGGQRQEQVWTGMVTVFLQGPQLHPVGRPPSKAECPLPLTTLTCQVHFVAHSGVGGVAYQSQRWWRKTPMTPPLLFSLSARNCNCAASTIDPSNCLTRTQ